MTGPQDQPPVTEQPQGKGPESARPGAGKGLRIALGLSVAFNMLVVGLVAGAVLRDGGPRDRMVRDLDLGPFTEAFRPEDREEMRRAFIARMPALRDMRQAMRGDFAALLEVLRSEPFDVEAARAILRQQRGRMQERVDLGQSLILDRLASMTPDDRAAFADRLERRLRFGGRD